MYQTKFEQAVKRTKELHLNCPEIEYASGVLLTQEKLDVFPYVLRNTVGEIGIKDLVGQCLSIHYQLVETIGELFNTSCYFTIGYIETLTGLMFHQSEADLKNLLENGIKGSSLNIHAWLTLPTMEIMDLSLPTSYAELNHTKEGLGGVIASHPDSLPEDLKYHPMLVGEDFLRKSGACVEFRN